MGAKWGQCALHMLACSRPPSSLPPYRHTHARIPNRAHTHSTGSPFLAWGWREGRCQHQQMPRAPILEGPLLFLPPFEIHGLCELLFSMFGLEMRCHFGRFYLSASVGVRGPGFGLKSLGDKGWRFNQPACVVWMFSLWDWLLSLVSLAGVLWPLVQCIQYLTLNLFLTYNRANTVS